MRHACRRLVGIIDVVPVAKKHKDSPRRMDAAVAAVMAHDRAATLAGVTRDSIYL
jgi:hypothetical protein